MAKRPAFRFRSLAVQIVLWTVLPLTLVLIGVAFTGVYSHERAMRSLVEERDSAQAAASAAEVREALLQRELTLQDLASRHVFHEQDLPAQRQLLAEAGNPGGLFAADLALIDKAGHLILSGTGAPPWLAQQDQVAALARAVAARQDVAIGPVFDASWLADSPPGAQVPGEAAPLVADPSAQPSVRVFLLGVPVRDAASGMVGVLAGPVSLSHMGLDALLSRAHVGEQGTVYLVDASARVLAHSQSEAAQSSLSGYSGLVSALQTSAPGITQSLAPDGERMTLIYAPLNQGTDWYVIIEQPWHQVMSPVLRYSQFMPLVAALAAVVALLTLYYGVQSLVRPLRALGRQAEQVAWGDFEATSSPVGGVQEIEDLQRTLDQMAKRIQSYQHGMHNYIAAITKGQEEERRRLARELHDDTAQALIALGQQVEMAQRLLTSDPVRAAERLASVRSMLAEAVQGVRRFSRDLRPIYLDDLGFIPALEMLTGEAGQGQAPSVQFSTSGEVRRLPPDMELAAYRIVQEALNNAIQHARSSHVWVEVRFEPQSVALTVRDDGQGFEAPDLPDVLARQGHFGLMGIQERALLYGGKLTIRSAPGQGTTVTVYLAYPQQMADHL